MNPKQILKEIGIKPSKKMGQSFLTSEKIAKRIVYACEIEPNDIIIEIGAGLGILTKQLCATGAKVFAVEKDTVIFEFLKKEFKNASNLYLINQDIFSLKLSSLYSLLSHKFKLVSNLPYSITSDFLYWLLDNRNYFYCCVITLQKEVAQKIYAAPKSKIYGAISVFFQFYMEVKPLFLISGNFFFPQTKVISQVIYLSPKEDTTFSPLNEKLFFKIVHTAFASRRRQLKNSLKLKYDSLNGIDLSRRPETLSYEEFIKITNALQGRI